MKKIIILVIMLCVVVSIVGAREAALHRGGVTSFLTQESKHDSLYQMLLFSNESDGIYYKGIFVAIQNIDGSMVHVVTMKVDYRVDYDGRLDYNVLDLEIDESYDNVSEEIDFDHLFNRLRNAEVTSVRQGGSEYLMIGDTPFIYLP